MEYPIKGAESIVPTEINLQCFGWTQSSRNGGRYVCVNITNILVVQCIQHLVSVIYLIFSDMFFSIVVFKLFEFVYILLWWFGVSFNFVWFHYSSIVYWEGKRLHCLLLREVWRVIEKQKSESIKINLKSTS